MTTGEQDDSKGTDAMPVGIASTDGLAALVWKRCHLRIPLHLRNDARTRVDAALHGLEIQGADVGKTADYPRGFFARWKWLP